MKNHLKNGINIPFSFDQLQFQQLILGVAVLEN
jgi:hypothetical protein